MFNYDKTYIIAEAGDSHLGVLETALEMCLLAKLAGADCIKFQHHIPDEEMLRDVPLSDNFDESLYEFLIKYALTVEQHKTLLDYCNDINIDYLCTPFSYKAAVELNQIGVRCFKIGSGEMTDIPTLEKIASFGKPMIISTGMSTFDEIDRTYEVISQYPIDIALANCVSEYPPNYNDMNLRTISEMIERYPSAIIGHSDHTPDLFTSFASVVLGAKFIEKHVIIDKLQKGPDQSVSIGFSDLKELVDGIRKIERALGNKKFVHEREQQIREWAFRSLVFTQNLNKGDVIKESDLWSKRPGTGVPAHEMKNYIGLTLKRSVKKNTMLTKEDFV